MHRVDGSGATAQNKFTKGSPLSVPPVPATVITDEWLNAVQEELAGVIEGAGISLNKNSNVQLKAAIAAMISAGAGGAPLSWRNKLINGNFRFWQRGTSTSVTTGQYKYQADRWRLDLGGTSTAATYSRQSFALGQTDVPGNPMYFARVSLTNGGDATNGWANIKQKIENVRTLSGGKATITIWMKANAAKSVAVEIEQDFGSGGSPSAAVQTFVQKVNLTTAWQKFTFTVDVPSIAGKTIGSNGDAYTSIGINFWMSAGSAWASRTGTLGIQTGDFDFAMAQVEEGATATAFECRHEAAELALCQRYYEKSYDTDTAPGSAPGPGACGVRGAAAGTAMISMTVQFKVSKRFNNYVAYSWDNASNGGQDSAMRCNRNNTNILAKVNAKSTSTMEIYSDDTTSSSYIVFYWAVDADFT